MGTTEKEVVELIDDIYSISLWMTGSVKMSKELVINTFKGLDANTPKIEVLKKFRDCYFEKMELDRTVDTPNSSLVFLNQIKTVFLQQDTDRKLSALLSEVCKLDHHSIAQILGKPLDTVNLWLSDGRKKLRDLLMFLCSLTSLSLT